MPEKSEETTSLDKDVQDIIQAIQKKRKQTFTFVGDLTEGNVPVIPTGLFTVDRASGVWGIPKGRIIEIYGRGAVGKTSLGLKIMAQAQRQDPNVLLFVCDLEKTADAAYASALGININKNFVIDTPTIAEEGMDVVLDIIKSKKNSVILIDSVTTMVPKSESEKDLVDSEQVGVYAKFTSRVLKQMVHHLSGHNSTVIFINQVRQKIPKGGFGGMGDTTSGGLAISFYASMRLSVSRIGPATIKDTNAGHKTKIKFVKNKLSAPFKEVETDLYYGSGFSGLTNLIDIAIASNIIKRPNKVWYVVGEEKFKGYKQLVEVLLENTDMLVNIRDAVLQLYGAPKMFDNVYIENSLVYGKPDEIRKIDGMEDGVVEADDAVEEDSENIYDVNDID